MGIKWHLTVVLISVFLIASETGNMSFGMYFLFCELLIYNFAKYNMISSDLLLCVLPVSSLFLWLIFGLESFHECIQILDFILFYFF